MAGKSPNPFWKTIFHKKLWEKKVSREKKILYTKILSIFYWTFGTLDVYITVFCCLFGIFDICLLDDMCIRLWKENVLNREQQGQGHKVRLAGGLTRACWRMRTLSSKREEVIWQIRHQHQLVVVTSSCRTIALCPYLYKYRRYSRYRWWRTIL